MTTGLFEPPPTAFELAAGSHSAADFDVLSFEGREAVNRLYRFDVRCVARVDVNAVNQLLGGRARLVLHGAQPRVVHGVVTQLAHERVVQSGVFMRLRIAPRLAFLSRRKTSRVFQDKTVPEIVRSVVEELSCKVELHLGREYQKREYCVQYQETDLSFVRRLLAEEGLMHFFRHPPADRASAPADEGREVLVIADSAAHYAPAESRAELRVRERSALFTEECIHELHIERTVRQGGVLVRGFDYERPKFVPVSEARVTPEPGGFDATPLRAYDHDRVLEDKTTPAHVAQLRLEELRDKSIVGRGESSCRTIAPGALFGILEHPTEGVDGQYAAVSVTHRGHQANAFYKVQFAGGDMLYENSFRCVPRGVPSRPKRRARTIFQVTETATVVGPKGEEIHTDELGRIKVQFHWDLEGKHDDKSSCWIRVMQPWAGTAWGSQFIPRVGMEVVVSFTGGDTDRPIVLGCVYNGSTPTPFPLPADKTVSGVRTRSSPGGAGFNQLSFQDQAGAEQVYLHAERDFDEVVEKDHTRTVRGKEVINVKESRLVEVAQDNVRVVRGSEVLIVEKDFILHVAGQKLIQVGTPPPTPDEDEKPRGLPEEGSAYAVFQALASLPMFEDEAAMRASQIRRSKLLWHAEQLTGDDQRAGQFLIHRVEDVDKKLDGLCGAVHLLTQDLENLPDRLRDPPPGVEPIDAARKRTEELLERADDLSMRIDATRMENEETVAPLEKLQKVVVDHMNSKEPRLRAVRERLEGYRQVLEDPEGLVTGRGGGGGGGDPTYKKAAISFSDYYDEDGKKGVMPPIQETSTLMIEDTGQIKAKKGFKIVCGKSYIELTPGSISIKAEGPIKVNGSEILLNC